VSGPPPEVLAEFGAAGELEPVSDGRATAWRAGRVVLKPLDMSPAALAWQAEVLGSLKPDAVRIAPPIRSRNGTLVVDGWTAWPLMAGRHARRWPEIIAAGERFHAALAGVKRPASVLDARTDPWARADRIAWGESPAGDLAAVPAVARLLAARRPVGAPSQLVHGDLTGNVLFADGLPPAVIDFSPYWRPTAFASAIVAVDAVVWFDADPGLLQTVAELPDGAQLLVRALLFRLLAEPEPSAHASVFGPAIDRVDGLANP